MQKQKLIKKYKVVAALALVLVSVLAFGALKPATATAQSSFLTGVTAKEFELNTVFDNYPDTDISRLFYGPGQLPYWSDNRIQIMKDRGIIPFVSMKDHNLTAAKQFVDDMPADIPQLYFTWHHEPERDMSSDTFRSNFCSFYDTVKSSVNASRVTVISAQTRQWTENKGNDYATYYPGNNCTDAFGVDAYVNTWQLGDSPTNNYGYPDPDVFLSKMLAFAQQVGKPLFLPELGSARAPGDTTDSARAAWVKAVGTKLFNAGGAGVIYWHTLGTGDIEFKLNQVNDWNDPAVGAWRDVMALTATPDPDPDPEPTVCEPLTNANNFNIPDPGQIASPVTVTGCDRNASSTSTVSVDIKHPHRGDLRVYLVAPDQTHYLLKRENWRDRKDNLSATYNVNLSSKPANGEWSLRVYDLWLGNVGYIDSWTLNY